MAEQADRPFEIEVSDLPPPEKHHPPPEKTPPTTRKNTTHHHMLKKGGRATKGKDAEQAAKAEKATKK